MFDLKTVLLWLVAAVMSLGNVVAWFSRRDLSRYDKGLDRLGLLERTSVTYDHLERVLDRMRTDSTALLTQMKHEGEAKHVENQTQLNRIEEKIDSNENRASKTRQDTQNELHALAIKFAERSRGHRESST